MNEIPVDILTKSRPTMRVEKKCEREFRKLMEGSESSSDACKQKCDFSENIKKRHKVDEEQRIVNVSSYSGNIGICPLSGFHKGIGEKVNPGCHISKVTVLIEDSVKQPRGYNLSDLHEDLNSGNKLEIRCQRLINLAVFCTEELSEADLCMVLDSLNLLTDSYQFDALAICHALLLFTLTTKPLTLNQIMNIEEFILNLAHSAILTEDTFGNRYIGPGLVFRTENNCLKAYKLCQKLFAGKGLDIDAIDVLTICCSSLRNLSICKMGLNYIYKNSTLKFILGMTGKATQEIVAENLVDTNEDCTVVSSPSHMVNQCLQILEHMLTVDPNLPCKTLDHEDFSLLHCLTRLLGWCISFLFQDESSENHPVNMTNSFHLSTLITILKILSILSFNPDQYASFTNIKGLMEKVMICILKAHFQSKENRFDVLVLALEIMINFFLKNKKTFVLLCLKKFQITHAEEVLSVDALLKILGNSLDKISD